MDSAFMLVVIWLITGTKFVAGLSFTLSASRVKLGTTGTLSMTCDVTEIDAAVIYNIQIRRETDPGSNYTWETLAEIEAGLKEVPVLDKDIVNDKGFVAGGVFDKGTPINTYLILDMNKEKLTYSDARDYRCELTYKSNITGSVASVQRNASLSIVGDDDHNKTQSDTNGSTECVCKTTPVIVGVILGVFLGMTNIMTIVYVMKMKMRQARAGDQLGVGEPTNFVPSYELKCCIRKGDNVREKVT
ncbi:uncharacterized protein LOC123561737 isoform X1 [Mercenaria mercenaria]|uniref:uncharacterized protein LOC123561737 isoform X1 n=1 Tax=Mercenaria mercenaria TaxID=6596 RepID=UPI00234F9E46|nr:uncharacterized protein LOC123561737 isoform X1 [Mercenaria mercenaria]XP_053408934.1 uncharacterized protein LOC123561737 isoform X1 [Mercenaria mercenaria]XP_053408935.1 uncharacterized protein LOC123561737 isoform X1 [Mercenaria mercenaria]XP_053408936.1 uncharacterized protein LOC123561737 isoform X1 [Mercenaria mercenaria]